MPKPIVKGKTAAGKASGKKTVTVTRKGGGMRGKKKITVSTGVERMDELLKGGIRVPSVLSLRGPTHSGKEILKYEFIAEGLKKSVPAIVVLTKGTTTDFRKEMKKVFPNLKAFEERGYMRYIDMYSLTVGLTGKNPYANYINGVERVEELINVISTLEKIYHKKSPYHRIVFSDLTTFHSKLGYSKTQDLVNSILARSDAYNSLVIFGMVKGIHPDGEIKALEDVMDGTIELAPQGDKLLLRVNGLGEAVTRDWVEYKFDPTGFHVTGSFALTRIQ